MVECRLPLPLCFGIPIGKSNVAFILGGFECRDPPCSVHRHAVAPAGATCIKARMGAFIVTPCFPRVGYASKRIVCVPRHAIVSAATTRVRPCMGAFIATLCFQCTWIGIQTHCVRSSSRHCLGGDHSRSAMHGCIHCHAVLPVHLDRHPNALCAFHLVHTLTRFASGKGRFSTAGSAASCASVSASVAQRTQNHRTVLLN